MSREERFFAAVAARTMVRVSVRAIVLSERGYLVQRPTDVANSHYAFIGGEYELGDSFETRLRAEFEEETSAQVVSAAYRFVVENSFESGGKAIQTLEHYFEVEIDRDVVVSQEPGLEQVWLSGEEFARADVRPAVVRELLLTEDWREVRHLVVPRSTPIS
jgi:ADP-ribose pyrophosphatase YjhB (NUDIX family)